MIDSTFIQFILFILPGYISISIYRCKYPVKIREDNHDLIWGTVFGLGQVTIISKLFPDNFDNTILTQNSNLLNILKIIQILICSGFIFGIIAIMLTCLRDKVLFKSKVFKKLRRSPQSVWQKINIEYEFKDSWAIVFLDDGSIYRGYIKYYQFNPNYENQDFLLAKASRVDENLKEIYCVSGKGVYLNTTHVKRIELF